MTMWMRVLPCIFALALITGQAAAQTVDAKGEKDLTTLGKKIDKNSSSADSGKVTDRIVDQWKGTKFKFDATSAPRELTAKDVQDLRQKRLGYGEISILLALAAKQPDAKTAKSLGEIVQMRESGTGFGKLAKELGYHNLGSVVKSVKASEKSVDKVASARDGDKSGKPDKMDKAEKAERPDKPEKPAKPEKPEKPEKPGR